MTNYTLFIVDDEPLIVEGLLKVIGDFMLPLEISGYAYSGEEALELVKELKPDIVLSDIRMKNLTGLELCRHIRSLLPFCKTILLSGYNDFSFAQTALQQKVFDYLLKPIDGEILRSCLQRAIEEITLQRNSKTDVGMLQKYLENSRPYIRDLLFNYIKSPDSEPLFLSKIFDVPPESDTEFYLAVHISFLTPYSLFSSQCYDEASNLFNLADYLLADDGVRHLSFFDSGSLGFVLIYPRGTPLKAGLFAWDNAIESIREMLEFNSNMKFSIGISNPTAYLRELPREYEQAKTAGGYRFFFGENKIIAYSDLEAMSSVHSESSYEQSKKDLLMAMMTSDRTRALQELDRFFLDVCYGGSSIPTVKQNATELFLGILNSVYPKNSGDSYPEQQTVDGISSLWQCVSIDAIKDRLKRFILLTMDHLQGKLSDKNARFIAIIKQIIEKNYREVSLGSICEEIQLSPSYTSNLFSSMEKMTIKEYIISIKIQKAKELLRNPSCKVYDVSDMVGYSDPKYFSQMFKKQTGLTPEQFRNSRGQ